MQFLNNKNTVFELLSQGAMVITPNNRLSEKLLQDYYENQTRDTVDKPLCVPYSTALSQAYQSLLFQTPELDHLLLLNQFQVVFIWKEIINADSDIHLTPGVLAQVMEAWEHCLLWEISPEEKEFQYNPQTLKFQNWWQAFTLHLAAGKLITEPQLVPYLLANNTNLFCQNIIWYCFEEFHPQQLRLQEHLRNQDHTQYRYDLKESQTVPQVVAAPDKKGEYQYLISWLTFQLQQQKKSIGVVVPNLEVEFSSLQRLFLQHFSASEFNISLGKPLTSFPLVAHALTWLQLDCDTLNPHQAALLLQSPYLGYAREEFLSRAQYLQESQLLCEQVILFPTFVNELQKAAPKLAGILRAITSFPSKASPEAWIDLFQNRLKILGYPGDYALTSENYQCFQKIESCFDEFRQFHLVSPSLNQLEAIGIFSDILKNTIFQAQKKQLPIQVLGLLEASGCEFDALWVMGLTDSCLPQTARLSAFIPPKIQKSRHMPHSLPQKELEFAKQRLERLKRGSLEAVFSYPRLSGDNPNLPCTLITKYPKLLMELHPEIGTSSLINSEEKYYIPLKEDEPRTGGTALLANQAKCPFKAFAEHRLKAKPTPIILEGLDNRERGELLHKVMELMWHKIQSQQELILLPIEKLQFYLDEAIEQALLPIKASHPISLNPIIYQIESLRIKKLVVAFMEWEKQRQPFEIGALEASFSIELAGFNFQVRVDRIDQVEDRKWVIDYKSTLPLNKSWKEERPQEPQLLLYSLLDEYINTLFFIQLKSGKLSASGFSEEDTGITGVGTLKKGETWSDYISTWRHQLSLLAEEFQEGYCPPQPTNPSICNFCDFQNLCRFQKD